MNNKKVYKKHSVSPGIEPRHAAWEWARQLTLPLATTCIVSVLGLLYTCVALSWKQSFFKLLLLLLIYFNLSFIIKLIPN